VARYSTEIARHYNPPFDKKDLEILNYAAILHDIGKIGIKEQILNKIEPLLDEEFLLIRSHPNIGADIIKPIKFLQSAATIAQHHHERYDGKGYPDGLKGEEIPLGARIICVADSFDAMTSTRAYRGSLPEEIALKELVDDKGTQFDPAVVDVFLKIYPDLKLKGVVKI
jgi:putative nucleotidyltransferase with HDIG domain